MSITSSYIYVERITDIKEKKSYTIYYDKNCLEHLWQLMVIDCLEKSYYFLYKVFMLLSRSEKQIFFDYQSGTKYVLSFINNYKKYDRKHDDMILERILLFIDGKVCEVEDTPSITRREFLPF